MSTGKNKHGLTRAIPPDVCRAVRKRCGYGCVLCGSLIIDYEHLDPEFKDARAHVAEGITLVCPMHHRAKGGMVSKDQIVQASAKPFANRQGFAGFEHKYGDSEPTIFIGKNQFRNVRTLLCIDGEDVLSINPPEIDGAPFRLNAMIRNSDGNIALKIVDNHWQVPIVNWDFKATRTRFQIWSKQRSIALIIKFDAPSIFFERINMTHNDITISCVLGENFSVSCGSSVFEQTGASLYSGCEVGIAADCTGIRVGIGGKLSNVQG